MRDLIDPGRDLGHVDGKKKPTTEPITPIVARDQVKEGQKGSPACALKEDDSKICEDCG